ncbi:hypothetical protein [Sphingobacterium sp. BN32]|uniref:hypothetical protein n=1 Tax=Sphingobacterium sp. BN32 TaxID=3058432 RepID=UPI00265C9DED|nr:hypothetical protein [Sphingobacterium sp. BN32]WKK60389.1 hypothetical protein QYC40_09120 [Sphingobacterium sp. BN32]
MKNLFVAMLLTMLCSAGYSNSFATSDGDPQTNGGDKGSVRPPTRPAIPPIFPDFLG